LTGGASRGPYFGGPAARYTTEYKTVKMAKRITEITTARDKFKYKFWTIPIPGKLTGLVNSGGSRTPKEF
jgi:hypothetical protein